MSAEYWALWVFCLVFMFGHLFSGLEVNAWGEMSGPSDMALNLGLAASFGCDPLPPPCPGPAAAGELPSALELALLL